MARKRSLVRPAGFALTLSTLCRTFGDANIFVKQGRDIQMRNTLTCSQRRIRNIALHDRPVDLIRHFGKAI